MARMPLREVDKVEILTLLDNTIDILMADTPQAKRFPLRSDALTRESLVAEHGFAAHVLGWSMGGCGFLRVSR